jgi:hypothetical protein
VLSNFKSNKHSLKILRNISVGNTSLCSYDTYLKDILFSSSIGVNYWSSLSFWKWCDIQSRQNFICSRFLKSKEYSPQPIYYECHLPPPPPLFCCSRHRDLQLASLFELLEPHVSISKPPNQTNCNYNENYTWLKIWLLYSVVERHRTWRNLTSFYSSPQKTKTVL